MKHSVAVIVFLGALASCTRVQMHTEYPEPRVLVAELHDAEGRLVGTATLMEDARGIRVTAVVSGLTPGEHGIHIHARGDCTPPDFSTAGGHFNPGGRSHGLNNPAGPHAGDLPNMVVGPDGRASYDGISATLRIGNNPGQLAADSGAVVIHAGRDDQMSDPAGNAGARVACGVVRAAGRRTVSQQ